jgi:tetratricopeptide (TPR) repeat protein
MRKLFLFIVTLLSGSYAISQTIQTYNIDSLKQVLLTDLSDTSRIWALNNLGRNILNTDTTLLLAEEAIALSNKINFPRGEAEAYNNIAYWFTQKGNYPKALENFLKAIQLSERVGFEPGLKRSFNNISGVYWSLKDYATSISYARKARQLSIKLGDRNTHALAASSLSRAFLDLHQYDSSSKYAEESFQMATHVNAPFPLYVATARLAELYAARGDQDASLDYFKKSLRHSIHDGRYLRIADAHHKVALAFRELGIRDSALVHAKEAFAIAQAQNLSQPLYASSILLSELYEGSDISQSLHYYKVALIAQDSLFSQEKNREIEVINFNETVRQREAEHQRQLAAEERKNNLQYAAIVLGLVVFVILFLVLSHSVIANEKLIRFLGVLALLIVFEFINLLLHPLLADITHHSPLMMLGFMVCIAAVLIPLHHSLEKMIVHKLVEKNKSIRLTAANKALENVGTNDSQESK